MAYTKLFASIVTSTIWTEDDQTRIVWITMLASANKNGEVHASVPGLARIAGVSIEACERALAKFLAPDPYSRTKDDQGRRIEEIDGGWALINHAKYRALASKDETIAANAERQKRHRERLKRNATVTDRNGTVTHHRDIAEAEAEAEAEADTKADTETPTEAEEGSQKKPTPTACRLMGGFEEFWTAYPKKIGKGTSEKAWKKLHCHQHLPEILTAIRTQKSSEAWTKEGGQYIPYPTTWLNRKGWEDQLTLEIQQPLLPSTGEKKKTYSAADHMRAMGLEE